jgi:hypothetical protein
MIEEMLRRFAARGNILELALGIVLAEEIADEIAEKVSRRVRINVTAPSTSFDTSSTKVIDYSNVTLPAVHDIECPAVMKEAIIVSNDPNIFVELRVDGTSIINNDLRSMTEISQYSDWIDAFEKNGTFVVRLSGVSCKNEMTLLVNAPNPDTRVERVLIKIDKLERTNTQK